MNDLKKFFIAVASSWYFIPYFILAMFLIVPAGLGSGNQYILMLLLAAVFGPFAFFCLGESGHGITFLKLSFGLVILALAATSFSSWWNFSATLSIPGSTARFEELNSWAKLNSGNFMDPATFLKTEFVSLAIVAVLAAATCGVGGVVMACHEICLTSYTASIFYVRSKVPFAALFASWAPWWILKCAGFLLISLALAGPLAHRISPSEHTKKFNALFLALGLACIAAELIARYFLGDVWREMLANSIN